MWGGQNEKGSFATSYIPTGAATATRNADVASVSTQAFPYSSTEGTLVVNASVLATVSGSRSMVTLISANDTQQSSVLGNNNGGGGVTEADFYVRNVSDQAWLRFSTAISAGTPIKLAGAYKNNDFGGSANGTTAISDPLGVVPNSSDTLLIGRMASATGVLNGHIRQITYLPRRISNTELQTRTS
jgi:hypothetical protein